MAIIETTIESIGRRLRKITLSHWGGGDINMLLKTGYEIDFLISDFEDAIEKLKAINTELVQNKE